MNLIKVCKFWNETNHFPYSTWIFFLQIWQCGTNPRRNILEGRKKKSDFGPKEILFFSIEKLYDSKKILLSLCKKVLAPLLSSFNPFFGLQHSLSSPSFCFLRLSKQIWLDRMWPTFCHGGFWPLWISKFCKPQGLRLNLTDEYNSIVRIHFLFLNTYDLLE
jgi:hypothetical protein